MQEITISKSCMISMEHLEVRVESQIPAAHLSTAVIKACIGTQTGTSSGLYPLSKLWRKSVKMLAILVTVLSY